jgi:hypothetical protein
MGTGAVDKARASKNFALLIRLPADSASDNDGSILVVYMCSTRKYL